MILVAFCLLANDPAFPPRPAPLITGVWPPGVTVGGEQVWTISGQNLGEVEAILATGPGLSFGPIRVDPAGQTLTVAVRASREAAEGYRQIRVDGRSGVSNLALTRVDALAQVVEVEPNDEVATQSLSVGTAVAGTIRAGDVDQYRINGAPGQSVTLDWETRRLGTAIIPVLTVTGPDQTTLGQARSAPGGDRDCRFTVPVPAAGWFEVSLRDNTYGGSDRARYRLRVDPNPESAPAPPPAPSRTDPQTIAVGDRGVAVNGQLDAPGKVDRYRVEARTGDRLRIAVTAAPLGSWLDSVLTLLGPTGALLAANDDRAAAVGPPATIDGGPDPDAALDLTVPSSGPVTIELTDRSGGGGVHYGYQLHVGPPEPDFVCFLLPAPDSADPGNEARSPEQRQALAIPGAFGAFNLVPGSTTSVPFLLIPQGRPGQVEVRAEGLPTGVEAEPVVVRLAPMPRLGTPGAALWDAPPVVDSLRLRVRPDALPTLGWMTVTARTRSAREPVVEHAARRVVGVDTAGGAGRPIVQTITTFPVRILGGH